jgi:hypothetical protein
MGANNIASASILRTNTFIEPIGIPGTAYIYVGYAEDTSGTGFSTAPATTRDYIAFVTSDTPISTLNATYFVGLWKLYRGIQGIQGEQGDIGLTGSSGAPLVNRGISATAPSSPQELDFYRNTVDKKVYTYHDSAWETLIEDGTAAVDITSVDDLTIGLNGSDQLYVKDGGIGSTQIASNSVINSNIQDNTITFNKINPASVRSDFALQADVVSSTEYLTIRSIRYGEGLGSLQSKGGLALTESSISLGVGAVSGGYLLSTSGIDGTVVSANSFSISGNVVSSYSVGDVILIHDIYGDNTGMYLVSTVQSVIYTSPNTYITTSTSLGYFVYQETINTTVKIIDITKTAAYSSKWKIGANQIAIGYGISASGNNSIAIGYGGHAEGDNSLILASGTTCNAKGENSLAQGTSSTSVAAESAVALIRAYATAPNSLAEGHSTSTVYGEKSFSSGNYGGTIGYSQISDITFFGITTAASATELYAGGYTDTNVSRIYLSSHSTAKYIADVIGIRTSNSSIFSARFSGILGLDIAGTTAGYKTAFTTTDVYHETAGWGSVTQPILAFDTVATGSMAVKLLITSQVSTTIRWTVKVQLIKIQY